MAPEPTTVARTELLSHLRRGTLEYCILARLRDAPSYGQELARALGAERTLVDSEGTLYPLLARLRRRGWVETLWQDSPNGPPRRYYTLTPDGREALAGFTEVWAPFASAVSRCLEGEAS
ncbi:PadR family transcriptional regulator [Actinotalea sp.]|uniref:PadR family transcriptional regulator n=1 Tax=Actinotalea sp. TaxID=1872145 RepID=UPI0035627975